MQVEFGGAGGRTEKRRIRVWDVPTRLFHWALLALILVSWFSGGEEETAAVHRISGMLLAGLIVFRIVWGFLGNEHARFAAFFPNPARIIDHLKKAASGRPDRHLGHNPVGGVAVFLLLAAVSACVITGLMSSGEGLAGPFAAYVPFEMGEVHELSFRALQALVVLHLIGVVVESWLAKDGLVPAMVTGAKSRAADEPGHDARPGSIAGLVFAVVLGAVATGGLLTLPQPAGANGTHERQDRDCEWHGDRLRCDDD